MLKSKHAHNQTRSKSNALKFKHPNAFKFTCVQIQMPQTDSNQQIPIFFQVCERSCLLQSQWCPEHHGFQHASHPEPSVCFFVLCNRHRFNRVPGAPPRDGLGVTYLPSTISSDAGYADLPLALLGAPVDIGALLKTRVTVSRGRTPGPRLVGPPSRDRTTCTLSA